MLGRRAFDDETDSLGVVCGLIKSSSDGLTKLRANFRQVLAKGHH
jgi:hypothetical protein